MKRLKIFPFLMVLLAASLFTVNHGSAFANITNPIGKLIIAQAAINHSGPGSVITFDAAGIPCRDGTLKKSNYTCSNCKVDYCFSSTLRKKTETVEIDKNTVNLRTGSIIITGSPFTAEKENILKENTAAYIHSNGLNTGYTLQDKLRKSYLKNEGLCTNIYNLNSITFSATIGSNSNTADFIQITNNTAGESGKNTEIAGNNRTIINNQESAESAGGLIQSKENVTMLHLI